MFPRNPEKGLAFSSQKRRHIVATQQHRYSPQSGTELDKTEARQGNSKKTNFRVLLTSLLLAAVAGIILVSAFWRATPPAMDRSSGGRLEEQGTAPAAAPESPAKPAPATAP